MVEFAKPHWVSIKKINPAPYNPRKPLHPDSAAGRQLRASVEEFGVAQLPVWNKQTGNLVAGHQRLSILMAQGVTKVLVSVVDLSLEKEKTLNLALNNISGENDSELLSSLLSELTKSADFDIDLTGFSSSDIDQILSSHGTDEDKRTRQGEDALESATDSTPIAQPGEIIQLGHHRLACGDCTDESLVAQLFESDRAHMLHTDPPYNVAYNAADRPTGKTVGSSRPIVNDKMSDDEYRAFTEFWLSLAKERMIPGSGFYIWNGFANFGFMAEMLARLKLKPRHVITWAKESFSPGFGDFNEQTEFCLYGRKSGGRRRWYGPKNESTLWSISRDRTVFYRHPTQKALALAERAIRNSSQRGEIVYDPFLGSGTTLIAAARMGRRCLGIEIEPHYCDVIVRRFITTAGRSAVSKEVLDRWGPTTAAEVIDDPTA